MLFRSVRKDAFYFYKANWTTNPMVYITGHTFTNRLTNFVTAKIYANCDSVELFANGISQGSRTSTNFIFTWPLTLVGGSNNVQAVGTKGATTVADALTWFTPIGLAITNPLAAVVYLNSTNDTLQLSATVTNAPGPFSFFWNQVGGTGAVTFGNSNAASTTARFSATGVYGLNLTASAGTASASAGLSVVVGPVGSLTNGLLAWWKMDETGGTTAADSSGNNVTGTLANVSFTSGHLSNAFYFNGSSSAATFVSPDAAQITLAGWVRADAQGNSAYPRIFDTPGYRLFFRFDGSGSNGVDFATYSTVNGDWFSGANTISLGAWCHVAASYDRSSFTNLPALYVNGTQFSPATITTPSGTQPSYAGTGYIGNKSGLTRAWIGAIDDLRIYNHLLSDAEVRVLAAMPPTNLAPVVNAGNGQSIIWPAFVNLNGTVTDDGNPNPPGAVEIAWSQLNGPGTATFGNPNALSTTVGVSTPGGYVFQLAANDGQVQTVSAVTVNVITRPAINAQLLSNALHLSWSNEVSWRLQCQTNPPNLGLTTNWFDVPGSTGTNLLVLPVDPANGDVFYRLAYP